MCDWSIWQAEWWTVQNAEYARNIALIAAAGIGLPLAILRSWTAYKQAQTGQSQLNLAEKGQKYGRYQKGSEMLGSELMSEREAGIFSLSNLAQEDMENFYFVVQKILCQFVRQTTHDRKEEWESDQKVFGPYNFPAPVDDVQTTMKELARMNSRRLSLLETHPNTTGISARIDLSGVILSGFSFANLDLRFIDFSHSKLTMAGFYECKLCETLFNHCDCTNTDFVNYPRGAERSLSGVNIVDAVNVKFEGTCLNVVKFQGLNLDGSKFERSSMNATKIIDCSLAGAKFLKIPDPARIVFKDIRHTSSVEITAALLDKCKTNDPSWFKSVLAKERSSENANNDRIV